MRYFRIVLAIGLVAFLLSIFMPWLSITFLAKFSISLFDIYRLIIHNIQQASIPASAPPPSQPNEALGIYVGSVGSIFTTLILYPVTAILGVISIVVRKLSVIAGSLGVVSGVLWIIGVESLKTILVQQATKSGGIFGGLIVELISKMVAVDYGVYFGIMGGLIILIAFFVPIKEQELKPAEQG